MNKEMLRDYKRRIKLSLVSEIFFLIISLGLVVVQIIFTEGYYKLLSIVWVLLVVIKVLSIRSELGRLRELKVFVLLV